MAARTHLTRSSSAIGVVALLATSAALVGQVPHRQGLGCPEGTVDIDGRFCIDRYEGTLVEVTERGDDGTWDPCRSPERGHHYRAVSRRGVLPQGYISQVQAEAACTAAGKRLCTEQEWFSACRGPDNTTYPYGERHEHGQCNDAGRNPVPVLFRGERDIFHFTQMNDPRLNVMPGTVAPTGQFSQCTNSYGVQDMVGNLHEWTAGRAGRLGVFRGGYFADAHLNGRGCHYATRAHGPGYHDYSTGFRCCADPSN